MTIPLITRIIQVLVAVLLFPPVRPHTPGVFATGRTLEECRRNLAGVIDEWLVIRLRRGLPIPPGAGRTVGEIDRVDTGAGAEDQTPTKKNELFRPSSSGSRSFGLSYRS
ncbi:type II toxin-antitoxin system HicB family antitoxin [Methanoculleus bourgensis]|uniref:type II toxin-antitoxin system HicB family antitoxin n=1 Tax=Methanoculleus bourgensis TaxID=83986 RepID=UPI0031E4F929